MAMALLLMAPFGFSLNSSTLIGLLLAIGRLVDDSVIDIHSVERHLRMGKDIRNATIDGITEVRLAVAASTLMLILALIPLTICGGITQLMFVGLVYPIIFGLLSSFLVSLTLTAVMASKLLKEGENAEHENPSRFSFATGLDKLDARYERFVRFLLKNRMTTLACAVSLVILGGGFYNLIGSEMMPLADVGQGYAVLEMQPGASYEKTAEAASAFAKILAKNPEIQRISSEIGSEPGGTYFTGYAMNQVNTASMMLTLSDKDERKRDIWKVIDGAREEALKTIPGIRRIQIKEMGSDVMASSAAPVQILVTGPDRSSHPFGGAGGKNSRKHSGSLSGGHFVGFEQADISHSCRFEKSIRAWTHSAGCLRSSLLRNGRRLCRRILPLAQCPAGYDRYSLFGSGSPHERGSLANDYYRSGRAAGSS
jgi:HAE1 family hydrophobic/amphiphilic exporter-1